MKTWLLNPRVVQLTRPTNVQGAAMPVVTVIDCPCGCAQPFVLPPIADVTFPALGEVLTQLQWRLLLNNYRLTRVHRIRAGEGSQCGWGGRIVAGRIFSRNDAGEDDVPLGVRIAETLAWLREQGEVGAAANGRINSQ